MRRSFNGFLSVLPPRKIVRWNISQLQAYSWNSDYPFQPHFSAKKKKKKKKQFKNSDSIPLGRERNRERDPPLLGTMAAAGRPGSALSRAQILGATLPLQRRSRKRWLSSRRNLREVRNLESGRRTRRLTVSVSCQRRNKRRRRRGVREIDGGG